MATGDTTARNSRASDWANDFTSATLQIRQGSTVLASHTLAGFGAPSTGVITANGISDATISDDGTADNAIITSAAGTYTLTVGLSGADLILNTLTYVTGQTSSVTSLSVTFPA